MTMIFDADRQLTDDELERAAALANIPTLLALIVQITGETRWLDPPFRPSKTRGLGDNDSGGIPPRAQTEVRQAALAALRRWLADGRVAHPRPDDELLLRIMSVVMGEEVPPQYGPMMAEALTGGFPIREVPVPSGFHVVIIGGGVSGICAGWYLGRAGIPCTIVEKSPAVGGTWHDNRYPGAGVDTPSHLYSYSFARHDWTHYFSASSDIQHYLEEVVQGLDPRCRVRLGVEVTSAEYSPDEQSWEVRTRDADGSEEVLRANVVISAVGALNRPVRPRIAGLDAFRGPSFHTARWPTEFDHAGKRLAVIGTGASAMQVVPAVAGSVASLTVFQRSPQWAAPFERFQQPIPPDLRRLIQAVPLYRRWYRLRLGWTFNDRIHHTLQKDPEWTSDQSINAVNEGYRESFIRYLTAELGDRTDLLPQVVPTYPPFLKRMLLDNGWFRTLTRDNVRLVTDPIVRVTESSVVTRDGTEHEVDALVLATGFDAIHFLASLDVVGRGGESLAANWGEDARAYLGMAVPGFPNFFTLYGPNLQPGHGGSLIFTFECQVRYIIDLVQQMFEQSIGSVECRKDVFDDYNKEVDEAHEKMIWTHPGAETYYRNARGRVVVNSPYKVIDYWDMTRRAALEDYVAEPTRG
jgi:4-hydroxyacetophenone monooxygenase